MKLLGKVAIVLMCLLSCVFNADAQRMANVSGTYTYVQREDETQKMAEEKAIQKARAEALAAEFGTLVEQTNLTDIKDGKVKFRSLGLSDVKGVWIADTKPPKFKFDIDKETGERVITVTVWGKAREVVTSKIDVKAYVLRNGTSKQYIDDKFNSGDQYFVAFTTPVDGFVAIYLMDENGDAWRLLPYPYGSRISYPVKADKEYIFFSRDHAYNGESEEDVQEYQLETPQMVEYNKIYIFFSPVEFNLPGDAKGVGTELIGKSEYRVPPMVNYEEMQKWIAKTRNRDKYMQVEQREITIHASSN